MNNTIQSNMSIKTIAMQGKTQMKTISEVSKKGSVKVSAKGDEIVKTQDSALSVKTTQNKYISNPTTDVLKKNIKTEAPLEKVHLKENAHDVPKPNRFAGIEKGESVNKGTAYIRATFNVNKAKNALKNYITNVLESNLGQMNAHYPYTAITEELILHIVRASGKFNTMSANKADLYTITLENIQRGLRDSLEFGPEVKYLTDSFNKLAMDYTTTFFDTKKALSEFIESKVFTNNMIHINKDALNFVCYILSNVMGSLTRLACSYSEYSKKNNVLIRNFTAAAGVYFTGSIRELVLQRLTEIESLFSQKKAEDKETDDAVANDDVVEDDVVVEDDDVVEDEDEDEDEDDDDDAVNDDDTVEDDAVEDDANEDDSE
jgi:hypothetical protein